VVFVTIAVQITMMSEHTKSTSVEQFYDIQWSSGRGDIFSLAFRDAVGYSYILLGDLRGRRVLEIGAGLGEQAVYFALQGAQVTVIDISLESLKSVQELAGCEGVEVKGVVMDAQQMSFESGQFEFIYINSVMMHVDCAKVMSECSRVLRKGGKLIIVEPLKYGLFVQGYRLISSYKKMNPQYMTLGMFTGGEKYFSVFTHREFYFFSCLLLPVFFLRVRWLYSLFYGVARFDALLFTVLPFLRRLAWVSVGVYEK